MNKFNNFFTNENVCKYLFINMYICNLSKLNKIIDKAGFRESTKINCDMSKNGIMKTF